MTIQILQLLINKPFWNLLICNRFIRVLWYHIILEFLYWIILLNFIFFVLQKLMPIFIWNQIRICNQTIRGKRWEQMILACIFKVLIPVGFHIHLILYNFILIYSFFIIAVIYMSSFYRHWINHSPPNELFFTNQMNFKLILLKVNRYFSLMNLFIKLYYQFKNYLSCFPFKCLYFDYLIAFLLRKLLLKEFRGYAKSLDEMCIPIILCYAFHFSFQSFSHRILFSFQSILWLH